MNDQDLQAISRRLNVTPAQVILSWAAQWGTAVVRKYEYEARLVENISVSWIYCLIKFLSSVEGSCWSLNCRTPICWLQIEFTWSPGCVVRSVDSILLNQEARVLVGDMSNLSGSSNRVVSCANEYSSIFSWQVSIIVSRAARHRYLSFWSQAQPGWIRVTTLISHI